MLPARKEVGNVKMKKCEVAYEVGGVLKFDEIECDRVDVAHGLVVYYNGDKCVAIYNNNNFVRATLL